MPKQIPHKPGKPTSLIIPSDLSEWFRELAALENLDLKDVIVRAMRMYMNQYNDTPEQQRQRQQEAERRKRLELLAELARNSTGDAQ
jgi:hypothetical protein